METRWLEDFVSLAETRSFSRSAQLRHVTQPAFSRRIQALEAWAGTDLVDRSSYPTSLTPAGETLYPQALEMLQALQTTRAMLRGHAATEQDVVEIAVPHTLAFTYFPAWVTQLRTEFGPMKSRLVAANVHDAVMHLVEGHCDLLIAYHHPSQPLPLATDRYDMLCLGEETIAPYARPVADGRAAWRLPGRAGQPLPYLGYAPGAYLGRVVDQLLTQHGTPIHLDRVYETDMAEGLKAMALEGHGLAFLPASAVRKEVRAGLLVRVDMESRTQDAAARRAAPMPLELSMEIRAYRQKLAGAARTKARGTAEALWDHLAAREATPIEPAAAAPGAAAA